MNEVNPEAWLAWVLERIQDHPVNRIAELRPWAYQDMIDTAERDAEAANATRLNEALMQLMRDQYLITKLSFPLPDCVTL